MKSLKSHHHHNHHHHKKIIIIFITIHLNQLQIHWQELFALGTKLTYLALQGK